MTTARGKAQLPAEPEALAVEPAREAFARAYAAGKAQVVSTRLVADLETPVSAMLKLAHGRPMSFLLESVEDGAVRGRYSVIGLAPDLIWRASGTKAEINRTAQADAEAFVAEPDPPLVSLRRLLEASRIALPADIPHIGASVIGYMGYDMVRLVEDLPDVPPDSIGVPDSIFVRPTITVVFDSVKDEMIVITPVWPNAGTSAGEAYAEAVARLESVVAGLDEPVPHASIAPADVLASPEAVSNTTREEFFAKVAKAKEYIAAGDVFQVIVGQRFSAPFTLPSIALYRALRRTNPSPFLFHLDFGGFALVGSSPEILVRVRDGEVTIRPLAGTIRRGATPEEDKALEQKLLADPKERAEHLMLVDLGRNDVGRVSEIGSVRVRESFVIERYSHVMHISSHVTGRLDKRHDVIDALMAGFPAGTLSGAPKVRAMEIIDELEKEKRGPYGGCVGYFSADGEMDSCIVLRTALVKDGRIYVQAGAGIVADSDAAAEQAECEAKSKALFKAAEEAVRFAKASRRGNR
ncbi:MAG: anthranilate synthase component I [Hyphomicrobiaceae bacterium]|nr:anthranilate synthase component I [Hyphomicrobiaceae bacterium]